MHIRSQFPNLNYNSWQSVPECTGYLTTLHSVIHVQPNRDTVRHTWHDEDENLQTGYIATLCLAHRTSHHTPTWTSLTSWIFGLSSCSCFCLSCWSCNLAFSCGRSFGMLSFRRSLIWGGGGGGREGGGGRGKGRGEGVSVSIRSATLLCDCIA